MQRMRKKSVDAEVRALRALLARERSESRRRAELFEKAIQTNDLREVGEEMYRYFFSHFGVYKGDITILTDYDEREFYDLVGWTPRQDTPSPEELLRLATQHCEYLRSLVEEQIFIGYSPDEEKEIKESYLVEQSMLESMITKAPRVVNDVLAELSAKEIEEAKKQQTRSWLNWTVLHPDNSKLLAKMHMSFRKARKRTLSELTRQLRPFENLLGYRILHTRDFKRVKYLSERDALTGLYLRPTLAKRWDYAVDHGARGRRKASLSLAMLDLDLFKRFNDNYGHEVGDRVLKHFAQSVQSALRGSDAVGRYGGEEFAALFPGADTAGVLAILKRIHDRIKDVNFLPPAAWAAGGGPEHLRFSAGIFTLEPGHKDKPTFDEAIKAADELLLYCKQSGRNAAAYRDSAGRIRRFRFED